MGRLDKRGLQLSGVCLIAEDECLLGMAVEQEIKETGLQTSGSMATQTAAMEWLGLNAPALAVLDCQLADGMASELARCLRELQVPIIVHSAFSPSDQEVAEFPSAVWITKPSRAGEIREAAIRLLCDRTDPPPEDQVPTGTPSGIDSASAQREAAIRGRQRASRRVQPRRGRTDHRGRFRADARSG